jgi:nitrate/nitrite sensing protein
MMRMRRTAAEGGVEGHLDGITGADWFKAATVRIDLLKQLEDGMVSDLKAATPAPVMQHGPRSTPPSPPSLCCSD